MESFKRPELSWKHVESNPQKSFSFKLMEPNRKLEMLTNNYLDQAEFERTKVEGSIPDSAGSIFFFVPVFTALDWSKYVLYISAWFLS